MDLSALSKMSYGMYLVTSRSGEKANGLIANTVFQVTAEPPQIAISINKDNLTCEYIRESRIFAVMILSKEAPLKFIGQFGFHTGRDFQKFEGVNFTHGRTGANIVTDYTTAYFEAEVVQELDLGTHCLYTGKIVDARVINDADPMTYDYYHEVKGGKTQQNAPTYVKG